MALGTIDSINHIESGIANGTIKVVETANGWQVSGDTYPVKEYLKREFSAKWDKDAQAWNIAIDDHYDGGRDSYHYGIFADACKAEAETTEATEAKTIEPIIVTSDDVIEGNYIDAVKTSCATIDYPTDERIDVVLDGKTYNRAVYNRVIWRNTKENTLVCRFVWINGKFYSIDKAEADTADNETIAYEIDVCEMQATFADGVWNVEPKTANGSFEPVEHIELTESDIANGYAKRAVEVVAHTQPTEEINAYGDYIEFRSVVLYKRVYNEDGQLMNEGNVFDKWCLSDAAREAVFMNKAVACKATEYAQLMEWQDEDGNAISYELDYGDEETGYDSIPYSGALESVIDEIECDGWVYCPCPANGCGEVWQLYQQEIDGMEGLGARAVCCAVFER